MKKLGLATLILIHSLATQAQKGIILEQTYTAKNLPGKDVAVTWLVTDNNCKMKMKFPESNGNTYFLPDLKGGVIRTYNDGPVPEKVKPTYFEVSLDKVSGGSETAVSRVTVKQTGEIKTIGSFKCEKIVVTTNKGETEMWVTKDYKPEFYRYAGFFKSSIELTALAEEKIKGVPLESVTKDAAGNVISRYAFKTATQQEISASEFSVPSGFVKQ